MFMKMSSIPALWSGRVVVHVLVVGDAIAGRDDQGAG